MNYQEYLQTKHWQRVRRRALRRARYRCQLCNKEKRLNAHHNNYDCLGHERKYDLVVLCRECHERFHGILAEPTGRVPPIGDLENLKKVLRV